MRGFGQQGMAQSTNFAFRACTIFRADIRVSYYVVFYFGFQIVMALQQYSRSDAKWLLFGLGSAVMQFLFLYLTVLVHEFGHGTMARYLGGRIDHILLWPFGGICFSTRPEEQDVRILVKNDFKVVAAGPATHIPQTAFWLCLAMLIASFLNSTSDCADIYTRSMDGGMHSGCFPCEGVDCLKVFVNPFDSNWGYSSLQSRNLGYFFLFYMPMMAIDLNLMLFLFNVFFPMFPADGAKLLTSTLMHCCHVRPYKAASVLIACSGTCAILLMAWGLWSFQKGLSGAISGGHGAVSGMSAFSGALPGFMGLMALQETCTIYDLQRRNQLSQHQYFRAARTDITRTRDEHGMVATLNNTGIDNPNQAFGNTSGIEDGSGCFICRCCWPRQAQVQVQESSIQITAPADPEAAQRTREDRSRFMSRFGN
eukprot:TRINITY_DN17960_c0_g1_i1.p1 TRINITY_DN17960_c0_g1~~TRINITY_DN17960_c0_g1_i1.p1  ORF type:complete len:424 (-),score=50.73 TRINITY_DN17960_c0_g1_i1:128-1399(-)